MTEIPRVSIVLPTYNGSRFLSDSIRSCLAQNFTDWELIIVDDASTDNTPNIISYFAALDTRIRTIHHTQNRRLPGALNSGFSIARGRYFTWTSDDNRYRREALGLMVNFMDTHPSIGVVYTDYTIMDENGCAIRHIRIPPPEALASGNAVRASFLYRREIADEIGGYDENLFLVEDFEYWLRVSRKFRLSPMHRDLYLYRQHNASLTERRANEIKLLHENLLISYLPKMTWLSRQAKAFGFLRIAKLAHDRGDIKKARSNLFRAIYLSPSKILKKAPRDVTLSVFGLKVRRLHQLLFR